MDIDRLESELNRKRQELSEAVQWTGQYGRIVRETLSLERLRLEVLAPSDRDAIARSQGRIEFMRELLRRPLSLEEEVKRLEQEIEDLRNTRSSVLAS